MRQYRAWDKDGGFMCGVGAIDFENKKIRVRCCPDLWEPLDKFILTQSTGLKDAAGKEIFEGDIVGYLDYECVVKFDDGELLTYWLDCADDECGFQLNRCDADYYGIIGNIHDNPDLLK